MKNIILAILLAISLTACATRPGSINASHVSPEPYLCLSCEELAGKMSESSDKLNELAAIQDRKATDDVWGVILIGVPFSKFTGDHEIEIARLKGEIEAVETAQVKNGCK